MAMICCNWCTLHSRSTIRQHRVDGFVAEFVGYCIHAHCDAPIIAFVVIIVVNSERTYLIEAKSMTSCHTYRDISKRSQQPDFILGKVLSIMIRRFALIGVRILCSSTSLY